MDFFLKTTNDLINWFDNHGEVNEVDFGDANQFDTSSITSFPYVYIIPTSLNPQGSTTSFTYQVLVTDVLDATEEPLQALNRTADIVIQFLKDKGLDTKIMPLLSATEVIYDQRQNRVYGWVFSYEETVITIEQC